MAIEKLTRGLKNKPGPINKLKTITQTDKTRQDTEIQNTLLKS